MQPQRRQADSGEAAGTLTRGQRRYLYLTAGVCGAAVLIVEILGAKMLAPYFGTSHFVWTAQIAVTLISLSAGYYAGGCLVDRHANLAYLFRCILAAAVYLCLTVPLCRPISQACLGLNLAVGSLVASAFLFLAPLGLLAMVAPFLVRVMTASLNVVGHQVGRLSAISTAGSVLGTVLIGYLLIPFFPNSTTMLCTSAVLAALAVLYLLAWGRAGKGTGAVSVMCIVAVGGVIYSLIPPDSPSAASNMVEVERRNSNFGMLQVMHVEGTSYTLLLNDFLSQNGYDTLRQQSVHSFTYMLHQLARCYTPKVSDALCIGMGVGIVPMQLAREGANVEVVEINPAMVPLAERYFDFERARVRLVIDDGRHFLNIAPRQYDTVLLDAFVGDSSPSHLMTREAFESMRKVLRPGGTLVINSFGDLHPGEAYYTASLYKTLSAVFRSVKVHAAGDEGNIYFVASDQSQLGFLREPDLSNLHPLVEEKVPLAMRRVVQVDLSQGRVLTDDFNPGEFYDARNRERQRRLMVAAVSQ